MRSTANAVLSVTAMVFIAASCGGGADVDAAPPPAGAELAAVNTLTAEEAADGWQLLFDGRTTAGWRGFKSQGVPAGWQVVDGALTRVGGGGDLMTSEQYEDFELAFEWKLAEGGNSGVMFRVTEDADATYHTGPEVQILDDARHPDGQNPATSTGANYALHAPTRDVVRPIGEWNEARLLVDGTHVEHWLNGEKIVEYELGSADWEERVADSKFAEWPGYGRAPRGHIVLQDHGDWVAYRNIRIRPR
jgi:hypothetical protein